MAVDAIPQPELAQIEQIGGADLVIGVLEPGRIGGVSAAAQMVREALGRLSQEVRAVVVCRDCGGDSEIPPVGEPASPSITFFNLPEPEAARTPLENLIDSYFAILTVGGKLGARACGVIGSESRATGAQPLVYRLVQPLLELRFDLVMPRYGRQKMEGLLNRSILSPLSRALYGERIQNPMGPDFAVSGKLLKKILEQDDRRRGTPMHPVPSITSAAVCGGFQVCESDLGMRIQPPTNWADLSTLLAVILAPVFADAERNAAYWQRIRGSKPVPRFGSPEPVPIETGAVDAQRMMESFQLGTQNLQDVWGSILPPTTLFELRKLARLPPAEFRMPDGLWASIVYDFVLGYRLRTLSRDHLLRSMTPLYLGWIASYAIEMDTATPVEVEARLERLDAAFEARKPYLLSRWRWPDRFNP